jgi:1-acyl-sn-glycerol-3-phosphate acyltransferase
MSSLPLLTIAILILALPWALMSRSGPRPEIRGGLRVLWWINALYCALMHRLETKGMAPLPEHGPALLIANHTCGVDHLLLQAGCRRVLGFMIAQEYYDFWLFRPFCRIIGCIPVKRDGHDLAATRAALRALDQGRVVPIFPEGKINPTSGREIAAAKPGAAFIALRARVPVIPAYICGTPPTNEILESLFTPSHARVVFGPPFLLSEEEFPKHGGKDTLAAATERLMSAIRALQDQELQGEHREAAGAGPAGEAGHDDRRPEGHPGEVPDNGAALVRA